MRSAHFQPVMAPAGMSVAYAHHSPMSPPEMIAPEMARIVPKKSCLVVVVVCCVFVVVVLLVFAFIVRVLLLVPMWR